MSQNVRALPTPVRLPGLFGELLAPTAKGSLCMSKIISIGLTAQYSIAVNSVLLQRKMKHSNYKNETSKKTLTQKTKSNRITAVFCW